MQAASLNRESVRDIDRRAAVEFGIQGLVLMENAGRGAADLLRSLGVHGPVLICAGKGNNAGDGFVIARHLESAGVFVRVLLFCESHDLVGDAAVNFQILKAAETPLIVVGRQPDTARVADELSQADWVVDALLGTGLQGTVREPYVTAISVINQSKCKVLAVDIPSGMDCDTGMPLGACVVANHTATFVARKLGFDQLGAHHLTGDVHVLPIGVPRRLLDSLMRSN